MLPISIPGAIKLFVAGQRILQIPYFHKKLQGITHTDRFGQESDDQT